MVIDFFTNPADEVVLLLVEESFVTRLWVFELFSCLAGDTGAGFGDDFGVIGFSGDKCERVVLETSVSANDN